MLITTEIKKDQSSGDMMGVEKMERGDSIRVLVAACQPILGLKIGSFVRESTRFQGASKCCSNRRPSTLLTRGCASELDLCGVSLRFNKNKFRICLGRPADCIPILLFSESRPFVMFLKRLGCKVYSFPFAVTNRHARWIYFLTSEWKV
jgi:hypothetical protein